MPDFSELVQQGSGHAWLFIPSAIILGILHGLEPGHSKTMMAAFIIAIRGTIKQAILLGLAATISHTIIVWVIALGGMYIWRDIAPETFEPYFQLVSAAVIIAIAIWMAWRTWKDQQLARTPESDHGDHSHDSHSAHLHGQDHHHSELRRVDTGHGLVTLEIFEDGVPPRWHFKTLSGETWHARNVTVITTRPDGSTQKFTFRDRNDRLESFDEIPEPHEFTARLRLSHGGHGHDYDLSFQEAHGHEGMEGLVLTTEGHQDAHELAHASDIRRRFGGQRDATTWQVIGFGLTGGLIPCPAAIAVLLLCLQLKQIPLGAVLVACFSVGLAITLVTVGATAALAVRHATKKISWFSTGARRAPYFSSVLIVLVGLYVAYQGWATLGTHAG